MLRTFLTVVGLVTLPGCVVPRTVDRLQDNCPPPEFGRPGWVRFCAGTGAWIGGIAGGVASIVLLPVTWPISLLAGDGFGEMTRQEFLFFPAVGGATAGHFLFGAPPDLIDHVFRRAWIGEPPPANTYELVPMEPPQTPAPADAPVLQQEKKDEKKEPPKEAPPGR